MIDKLPRLSSETLPKLLIVDDEEHIREGLKKLSTSLGFEVYTSDDGITGCEDFRKVQPDLVILDIYMPRMNGLMVMHKMKEIDPDCPIILITGFLHYELLIQRRGIRPDGFILKPFKLQTVAELMVELVEKRMAIAE